MRLLYWTEFIWPHIGGIQVMASQTLPALRRRGYEIAVVSSHIGAPLPDEEVNAGIRVHRFAIREAMAANDADSLARIAEQIAAVKRRFKPDLVHMNFAGPSMLLYFRTASAHRAPLIVAFRGEVTESATRDTLLGHAVDTASWVVGVSRAVLGSVVAPFPEIASRSSVIYNGFEEPALVPSPLHFDAPRILCLGRLVAEKCFDLAVAAMPRVLAAFPKAKLLIAGDGPERHRLEGLVSVLGLGDATSFLGWISPDDVHALLNDTTLLVMPSRSEGLPGVAIQAAQMGRPVIATRVGGTPEVVAHGETGLLVAPGDVRGLGDSICALLGNPRMACELGVRARDRAGLVFDWQTHVDAYDDLYRRLV